MDLSRFESLGDNCEFGFVARKLKAEDGGLFRWARVDIGPLIALLSGDFADFYRFDRLIPFRRVMVIDTEYGACWHSEMTSQRVAGQLVFDGDAAARRAIHAVELRKQTYLLRKFLARLRAGGLILVIKSNSGIDPAQLDRLEAALQRQARGAAFWILELRQTDDPARIGHCTKGAGRRLIGHLGAFADYRSADDFDLAPYERLLPEALALAPQDDWGASVAAAAADLAAQKVTLPLPHKTQGQQGDVTSAFAWGQAATRHANSWSRSLESAFRLHAHPADQPRAALIWSELQRPGQWEIAAPVWLAVEESLPVTVDLRVLVDGAVQGQRRVVVASRAPQQITAECHAAEGQALRIELEVLCEAPKPAGSKAVLDIGPLTLEAL